MSFRKKEKTFQDSVLCLLRHRWGIDGYAYINSALCVNQVYIHLLHTFSQNEYTLTAHLQWVWPIFRLYNKNIILHYTFHISQWSQRVKSGSASPVFPPAPALLPEWIPLLSTELQSQLMRASAMHMHWNTYTHTDASINAIYSALCAAAASFIAQFIDTPLSELVWLN